MSEPCCREGHPLTAADLLKWRKLEARLAEAEKDATRSRHEWQRECEDTDLLLQGMGLCPSEYRSECGSLLLARIRHKMGHIGLRLDETLARLAEAERRLASIIGLCGQEGCDGEPYDTFYRVARGEFDPHVRYPKAPDSASVCAHWWTLAPNPADVECKVCGVKKADQPTASASVCEACGGTGKAYLLHSRAERPCPMCQPDQPEDAGK